MNSNTLIMVLWSLNEANVPRPRHSGAAALHREIYVRNFLGWLETWLAQNALNYLKIAQVSKSSLPQALGSSSSAPGSTSSCPRSSRTECRSGRAK